MSRASLAPGRPALLGVAPGVYTAYMYRNIAIVFWFGPATLASTASFVAGCKAGAAANPEGTSMVHIMLPGGRSMPSAAVRSEFSRLIREHSSKVGAVAVVLRGGGFWASALSSMVHAIVMFAPRGFKLRVFNACVDVSDWLPALHFERTGVQIDPEALLRAIQWAETDATRLKAAA